MRLDNIEFTIENDKLCRIIDNLDKLADQLDAISPLGKELPKTNPLPAWTTDQEGYISYRWAQPETSYDQDSIWRCFPYIWKTEIRKRYKAIAGRDLEEDFPELISLLRVDMRKIVKKLIDNGGYINQGDPVFIKMTIVGKIDTIRKRLQGSQTES